MHFVWVCKNLLLSIVLVAYNSCFVFDGHEKQNKNPWKVKHYFQCLSLYNFFHTLAFYLFYLYYFLCLIFSCSWCRILVTVSCKYFGSNKKERRKKIIEKKWEAEEELMTTRFDLRLTNQRKGTSPLRPLKMAACDVTAHRAQDGRFEDGLRER